MPRCPVEEITCQEVLQAYAYWQRIKPEGAKAPTRSQLDPLDIPKLLPHTILTEISPNYSDVSFRLVGTKVATYSGCDYTGRTLREFIKSPAWQDYWMAIYKEIAEEGHCVFGKDNYDYTDRNHISFEWVMLPLSSDGQRIDMTFEVEAYPLESRSSGPAVLGTARRFLSEEVGSADEPDSTLLHQD